MPQFCLSLRSADGSVRRVDLHAANALAAVTAAVGDGQLVSVREGRPRKRGLRCSPGERTLFFRALSDSLRSGLPLIEALEAIAKESRSQVLQAALSDAARRVNGGSSFAEAAAFHPELFESVDLRLLEAAERANCLDGACSQYADYLESVGEMNHRLVAALIYPAVISCFVLAMLTFMLHFIVGGMYCVFREFSVELPRVTMVVHWVSRVLAPEIALVLVGVIILSILITTFRAVSTGRVPFDPIKFRIPLLRSAFFHADLGRQSGLLALVVDNNVPLVEALLLSSQAAASDLMAKAFRLLASAVERGEPLPEALHEVPVLPEAFAWRVALAEGTGTLPEALRSLSRLHLRRADASVRTFSAFFEPALILTLAAGVGLIVFAMYTPLVAILSGLSGGG